MAANHPQETPRAFPKQALAIPVIAAILLTGCTQPDPNAKPTYTCTPATGSPGPCYKAEHDLQAKQDKLYAEAEAVYRKYLAEDDRISHAGGTAAATAAMKATLTGTALSQATADYREMAVSSTKAVGGAFKLGYLRRIPGEVAEDSVATIEACIDATSVTFTEPDRTERGNVSLERAYFFTTDAGLRIGHFKTFSRGVSSCN